MRHTPNSKFDRENADRPKWFRQTPMIIFAGYRDGIRIGHQHLEFAGGDLTLQTGISSFYCIPR